MPKSKIFPSFDATVSDIPDNVTIGFGGFAVVGQPVNLTGARAGAPLPEDAPTLEWLGKNEQIKKVICAFTAPTRASQRLAFTEYYESGRIDAELVPQGTLAERRRAPGGGTP